MVVFGHQLSVNTAGAKVLDKVDIQVDSGDHFTILGGSGSGKSVLVEVLLNLRTHEGEVQWLLSNGFRDKNVRAVLQNQKLERRLRVKELIAMHKALLKSDEKMEVLLNKFDLYEYRDYFTENLPLGIKRILQLLVATIGKPKVLILDNIDGSLDLVSAKRIWNYVKRLRIEDQMTIIATSDEITPFVKESTKLMVLEGGKVVATGNAVEIVDKVYKGFMKARFIPSSNFLYTKFDFSFVRKDKWIEVAYHVHSEKALYENIVDCGGSEVQFTQFTLEDAINRLLGYDWSIRKCEVAHA